MLKWNGSGTLEGHRDDLFCAYHRMQLHVFVRVVSFAPSQLAQCKRRRNEKNMRIAGVLRVNYCLLALAATHEGKALRPDDNSIQSGATPRALSGSQPSNPMQSVSCRRCILNQKPPPPQFGFITSASPGVTWPSTRPPERRPSASWRAPPSVLRTARRRTGLSPPPRWRWRPRRAPPRPRGSAP